MALAASLLASAAVAQTPIRFGLTPAIVDDQYTVMSDWREYLQRRLHRPVEFVQRDSYRDTIDLLKRGKLDFAWVSDFPYVYLREKLPTLTRLLLTPVYRGRPNYQAYLIVPASDTRTRSLQDLRGTVFAYADPYSHSGYLVPRYDLARAGEDPAGFFRKTFFTWSHRRTVEAVAAGLADGASVDGFVWDTLAQLRPGVTALTRIVSRSHDFGFPPIVVRRAVPADDAAAVQSVLMDMNKDPEGAALLKRLNLDGFGRGDDRLYDEVARMMGRFDPP